MSLFLRSLLWTLLFPGLFAGFLPWRYFGVSGVVFDWRDPLHLAGGVLVAAGTALLLACIAEFARSGRGTLSPVDPPTSLVVRGLYRFVRNPMYLSVSTIILGEVLLTRSTELFIYWLVWFSAVNLFVMGYEEPYLRRTFGESYERYARSVPRWIPRVSDKR